MIANRVRCKRDTSSARSFRPPSHEDGTRTTRLTPAAFKGAALPLDPLAARNTIVFRPSLSKLRVG
jgi:hypothetical protein